MTEHKSHITQEQELQLLDWTTEQALGCYAKTLKDFQEAQAILVAADETIERINQGLPAGFKVGTETSFSPDENYNHNNVSGYNKIYRQDAVGGYIVVGGICTEGARMPFLGDRIMKTEDSELVIINDELQLGLSVKNRVFVVDTANDPTERTLFGGGSKVEEFEKLLSCIQVVPRGKEVAYDFNWL